MKKLSPLKIGSVLKFEDIRFVPDKSAILKESKSDIEKLISVTNTFNSNTIKQILQQMMPEYEPLDYYAPIPNENIIHDSLEMEKSVIKGQA